MNFFEHQARARRHTGRLVLLMAVAILSLIALTSGALIMYFESQHNLPRNLSPLQLVAYVSLAIVGVVLLGGLFKAMELSDGGKAIAERLDGRLINLDPQDLGERRVLNVVEEMAIASGTPVPSVYVLEDASINAFAAGLTPQDAVIGITRGAVALLDREELQGVIAHEFSHIYNGDMRLNTRLTAVVHGLLLVSLIGSGILRVVYETGSALPNNRSNNRSNDSSDDKRPESFLDKLVFAVVLVGGAFWLLGYVGMFFGNLIKSAVSREREFLADASAVQYTRNPQGIAGALKKIGGHAQGSELQTAHAAEFSHLYFGAGLKNVVSGVMATHPPLTARILRVDPAWDGQYPEVALAVEAPASTLDTSTGWYSPTKGQVQAFDLLAVQQSIDAIGEPGPAHLELAKSALASLPEALRDAAHDCIGAQALMCGLLLDPAPSLQARQMETVLPTLVADIAQALTDLQPSLASLAPQLRLPLIDLAIPALKQVSVDDFKTFRAHLAALIQADGQIDLLEWSLLRIIEINVLGAPTTRSTYRLEQVRVDIALLMGALARAGNVDPTQARQAFDQACASLSLAELSLGVGSGWQALEAALNRLRYLHPLKKPALLKAMAVCIEHDGQVTATEAQLMRAVADVLDCPMPPLLGTSA